MSLRIFGAGLLMLTLVIVSGCHSSSSRYGAACAQPGVVAASPPCPTPCNTCGTPPPPGTITAVPGF